MKTNKFVYGLLITLIIVCAVLVIFLVRKNDKTLTPDYAPGTIDTNAIKEQDNGEKVDVPNNGGGISLSYSNVVMVDMASKDIKMYFKNPSSSRESVVLEIIIMSGDEEYIITKSDLLPPGYALYNMKLDTDVKLKTGGYNGIFRTTYYDEQTGEKEIINSEIEISIEVK